MTSVGCLALMGAAPGLHGGSTSPSLPGSLLDVSAGGVLRVAASLVVLSLMWWPFVVAAAAGAWLVFAKAGRPGWACLIPGYNGAEFLRVAKLPAWLWVLFFVPFVNLVLFATACVRVARAFRKGPRFAAGLMLLPPVYMTILGMGAARYRRFEVVAGAAEGLEPGPAGAGRAARSTSATAGVKLLGLSGDESLTVPGRSCGAGEARLAAGGDRCGRPRAQTRPPLGPARPRLHLV